MNHTRQEIRINNDFLQIFYYPERKNFDFIVKTQTKQQQQTHKHTKFQISNLI
jgi:hypothetical protein